MKATNICLRCAKHTTLERYREESSTMKCGDGHGGISPALAAEVPAAQHHLRLRHVISAVPALGQVRTVS